MSATWQDRLRQIQGYGTALRTAAPHLNTIISWLANPNSEARLPRNVVTALGGLFVGTTDEDIRAYLTANLATVRQRAAREPETVLRFIAGMGDTTKLVEALSGPTNAAALEQARAAMRAMAPTMTLSSVFNTAGRTLDPDVSAAINGRFDQLAQTMPNINTTAELAQFVSCLSEEQVRLFADRIKQGTTNHDKVYQVNINLEGINFSTPAGREQLRQRIEEALNASSNTYGNTFTGGAVRTGLVETARTLLQEEINKIVSGNPPLSPQQIATYMQLAVRQAMGHPGPPPIAPNPELKDRLLQQITEADPDRPGQRRLKSQFSNLVTVDLLMANRESLVDAYLPEGVEQSLTQLRAFLQGLDRFIPGLSGMVTSFLERAAPMISQFASSFQHTPTVTAST